MSTERLILSEKYKAFLRCNAPVEFLEGTTAAGKTTVGLFKFMCKVAESPKKLHILAADDTGAAEKNIINKDLGILDDFGILTEYKGNGSGEYKMPHILFHTSGGDKIIFVVGYGNKSKWKDALGGQYGCLYIDEINTANIEFVREASMRCDYLMATLNPDDPSLDVYKEYINCARPLPEWADSTPQEIKDELKEKPGWVHWFFSFDDNAGLPEEKKQRIIQNTPKGTKIWKNKIEGLRGKATGLVFSNFDCAHHVRTKEWAKQFVQNPEEKKKEFFMWLSAAVDTSYSQKSPDTIAFSFLGITNKGKCIVLDEKVYSNAELDTPLAPSDTVKNLIDFLDRNRKEWGLARNVFLDSADQATMQEWNKYKRRNGCIYTLNDAWKQMEIIDRINAQLGWLAFDDTTGIEPNFYVLDTCPTYISELETYSWKEDKDNTPEDGRVHMVNSVQYGWIPYQSKIYKR